MAKSRRVGIRSLCRSFEKRYGASDLSALLSQYAIEADRAIQGKIDHPAFYDIIEKEIIRQNITECSSIIEVLQKNGECDTYRALSCFYPYAVLIIYTGLIETENEKNADMLLSDAVSRCKKLSDIETVTLYTELSSAEKILLAWNCFQGTDEQTQNDYRRQVIDIAKRKHISEKEAAEQLLSEERLNPAARCAKYYFPVWGSLTFLLLWLSFSLFGIHNGMLLFLIIPMSEIGKMITELLFSRLVPPRPIPRKKLTKIPKEGKTLVIITALLSDDKSNEAVARRLRDGLYANRDDNVEFGLLTDLPECERQENDEDDRKIASLKKLLLSWQAEDNKDILFFCRPRRYSLTENAYMGWERKRGAVIELVRHLCGKPSSLRLICGNENRLRGIRYVITLDADTRLHGGAVQQLVGAMLHPQNKPVIQNGIVKKGHAIIAPRMETTLSSAGNTPFSLLMNGGGGTDLYATGAYETYQTLFDEGIFCGKGIFDVNCFEELIDGRFPESVILSHDQLEGFRLRAGTMTDLTLYDESPKNPPGDFDRNHRWVRGDLQSLCMISRYVKNADGQLYRNPISLLSRIKLIDNIRRALLPVSAILSLLCCLFLPENLLVPGILLTLGYLLVPGLITMIKLIPTAKQRFFSQTIPGFFGAIGCLFYRISSLLQTAVMNTDAILRAGYRLLFSRQKLLEWKTSAETEKGMHGLSLYLFKFFPSLLGGVALLIFHPYGIVKILAVLFAVFPFWAYRIGQPFKKSRRLSPDISSKIAEEAAKIWQFFADYAGAENHYLPPDNVQFSPVERVAKRTSPTNIGLYLLACLAARDFDLITTSELFTRIKRSLTSIGQMVKWHGHLYNWYSTETLDVIGTPYVSTVDSGNFISALVALKEGLSDYADGSQRYEELTASLHQIIGNTDFSPLYDPRKKLLMIGICPTADRNRDGYYDQFMSEARTTSYFAVASGQIPREHFQKPARHLISCDGYVGLSSWTGTMFEYLMPTLLLPTPRGSLSYEAVSFAVHSQRKHTIAGLFGKSECGYYAFDRDMNYQYKAIGDPSLGIKANLDKDLVIAPYATFLCLPFIKRASLANLRRLSAWGMEGVYGYYEALDMTPSRVGGGHAVIRSYMAHHMGMSLISCANACFDFRFVKRFIENPFMHASLDLLEEKIPTGHVLSPYRKKGSHQPDDRTPPPIRLPSDHSPIQPGNETAVIAENGISVIAHQDILRLSSCYGDIAVDPFLFGVIHRPRLLFSADGRHYDALSGTPMHHTVTDRLLFYLDEKELFAKTTISLFGKYRTVVISFEAFGHFKELCPLLLFEPSLCQGSERMAHPAYADISLSVDDIKEQGILLYRKRSRESVKNDLYLAVSMEGGGSTRRFEARRDILGLMYDENDILSLLDRDFQARPGTLIHPFCAIKKESRTTGRYRCHFLLSIGRSAQDAISSLLSTRRTLASVPRVPAGQYAARLLRRATEERLSGCPTPDIERYVEILLSRLLSTDRKLKQGTCQPIDVLYRYGLSGDLPLIVFRIDDPIASDSPLFRLLTGFISAGKFLTLSGVRFDMVILYQSDGDYGGHQKEMLTEIIEKCRASFLTGHSGGITLIDTDEKTEELLADIARFAPRFSANSTFEQIHAASLASFENRQSIIAKPVFPESMQNDESYDHKTAGGFFQNNAFTVIKSEETAPRSFVLASAYFGTLVTHNSLGYTWIGNSHERRLTPYCPDPLLDFCGERLIADINGVSYDLCGCAQSVTFTPGSARYSGHIEGILYTLTVSVDQKLPCKILTVSLPAGVRVHYEIQPILGQIPKPTDAVIETESQDKTEYRQRIYRLPHYDVGFTAHRTFFQGNMCLHGFILGAYPAGGEKAGDLILSRYDNRDSFIQAAKNAEKKMQATLPAISFESDDTALNVMLNRFLPYQVLSSRFFGKTGFSQSGGAFGFRDQLQDCLCLLRFAPDIVRTHLIRCAAHQYEEGDVMHWWHPIGNLSFGVRTRCSDDYLWLPYVVSAYVSSTGDTGILSCEIPYLSSKVLEDTENDRYERAEKSRYKESLYYHCTRAIDRALSEKGTHGLPLIGSGDWNDGINLAGKDGGESVWLGMFLIGVIDRFLPFVTEKGDAGCGARYREMRDDLRRAVENSYSGNRYLRGYFGDGYPIGGPDGIDILPQAAASVIGLNPDHVRQGLRAATLRLYDNTHHLFKLLYPPYPGDDAHNPGYIAAYPPGIRENGGQYTHAAVWGALGLLNIGEYALAADILLGMNPAKLSETEEGAARYGGEPYALAGDVSASPDLYARCGWTLYTGAAGWYYTAVIEGLCGISVSSDFFTVTPHLSDRFSRFGITVTRNQTKYRITAKFGDQTAYLLDGKNVNNLFYFDHREHLLEITVEKKSKL